MVAVPAVAAPMIAMATTGTHSTFDRHFMPAHDRIDVDDARGVLMHVVVPMMPRTRAGRSNNRGRDDQARHQQGCMTFHSISLVLSVEHSNRLRPAT